MKTYLPFLLNAVSTFTKARHALHTAAPSNIFCRDKELAQIQSFLCPLIENKKPGSMYISGRPGTGKTACVTHVLSNNNVMLKIHLLRKLVLNYGLILRLLESSNPFSSTVCCCTPLCQFSNKLPSSWTLSTVLVLKKL